MNNLDVVNLAIFEHEEVLRRHHLSISTATRKPFAPWSALRAQLGRRFGARGGDRETAGAASPEAAMNRPVLLPMVPRSRSLPVAIADEAIDRAA